MLIDIFFEISVNSVKPNGHFSRQSSTESGVFNHNRPKLKTNGHFTTYMQTRMDISPASEIANPLVLQASPKMVTRNNTQPGKREKLIFFFYWIIWNISSVYFSSWYCYLSQIVSLKKFLLVYIYPTPLHKHNSTQGQFLNGV